MDDDDIFGGASQTWGSAADVAAAIDAGAFDSGSFDYSSQAESYQSDRDQQELAALRAAEAARQARAAAQAKAAQDAARIAQSRVYTPMEVNPTRTQTQIELDAQRLRDRATNIPLEQQMKERLIGSGIGAIVPVGGMLYSAANAMNRSQMQAVADQLLQQGDYRSRVYGNEGLFGEEGLLGTGFLAGTPAASYVPVYDENDNLVGSIGVDAEGQALRYTGPRIEDYSGFGADLVTRDPFENMNQGGDNDDTAAALVQPQAAAPPQAPASQIPLVPLPSAFVGQQQGMPLQRPVNTPMTQATQVPQMQPFRPGAPAPQGIMATPQALRPSYINIGRNNPLQQ